METSINTSNRRKVMFVSQSYVGKLLSRGFNCCEFIAMPEPFGLPPTAKLVGVWNDYQRNAFSLVFEDASFEEVPEGLMCPEINVKWESIKVIKDIAV
jgi:hypothetical protein